MRLLMLQFHLCFVVLPRPWWKKRADWGEALVASQESSRNNKS